MHLNFLSMIIKYRALGRKTFWRHPKNSVLWFLHPRVMVWDGFPELSQGQTGGYQKIRTQGYCESLDSVKVGFQVCRYAYEAYIAGVAMQLQWNNSIGYFESGLREQVFKAENLDYEANITYVGNGSAVFQIFLKRKMTRIAFETIGPTFLLVMISSVSTPIMSIYFELIKLKMNIFRLALAYPLRQFLEDSDCF